MGAQQRDLRSLREKSVAQKAKDIIRHYFTDMADISVGPLKYACIVWEWDGTVQEVAESQFQSNMVSSVIFHVEF